MISDTPEDPQFKKFLDADNARYEMEFIRMSPDFFNRLVRLVFSPASQIWGSLVMILILMMFYFFSI